MVKRKNESCCCRCHFNGGFLFLFLLILGFGVRLGLVIFLAVGGGEMKGIHGREGAYALFLFEKNRRIWIR